MVPYQLHWPPVDTELLLATGVDDELLLELTGGTEDELLTLLTGVDDGVEDTAPRQILPVTVGRSALPPRLST